MAKPAVEVDGLKEFRQALKAMGAEWPVAFRKVQKSIADDVAERARGRASAMGGVQARAAGSIRGYATQTQASIGFPSGGIAGAAFWGMNRHTGWYAKSRYWDSAPQHPPWVGSSWEPGVAGQGPYAINDALAERLPEIDDGYLDAVVDLARRAFPT